VIGELTRAEDNAVAPPIRCADGGADLADIT